MKQHTSIAAKAIAAGLSFALTMGSVAAPVTIALADDTGTSESGTTTTTSSQTGSVTIEKNANNASDATTTIGYQIFKADVVDNGSSKTASNIAWASDEVATVVNAQIKASDSTYTGTTAQEAADYLATHLPAEGSSGTDTIIESGKLYSNIANALRDDENLTPTTLTIGEPQDLSEGYWLFLTNSTSTNNGTNQVGTAPIYAVVGGSALTISPKSNLPSVNKEVKNDATGADWSNVADSQVGQNLQYRLTGTVADALPSYTTYYYKFTDTLSAGLTADKSSVAVTVKTDDKEYTVEPTSYTTSLASNTDGTSTLGVEFTDLKSLTDTSGATIPVNATTQVFVTYNAKLDKDKAYKVASGYNDNFVKLTYSNNPGTDSKGDTETVNVRDYTYKLNLVKVDSSQQSTKLSGAKFTIQATNPDEGASTQTQYVQADGTLGTDAHEFTTGDDGSISVSGLDVGTYTVVETQAPDGYNTVPSFDFSITATYENGALTKVGASTTNATAADASVGSDNAVTVTVTVKDKAGMSLPLTGQAGVTLTWVAGGVVLAFGITHLVRSRKRDENSAE